MVGRPTRAEVSHLWLLLGKPPDRSPVIPQVIANLRARGATVRVHVDGAGTALPAGLADADVVALRGLRRSTLAAVAELETQGLRCCNSARSTLTTLDRSTVQQRLADAGIPVPTATVVADADDARLWAAGRPVAVKAEQIEPGQRKVVIRLDDPDGMQLPVAAGPLLVQHWVPNDGVDRKLYVMGTEVRGLLKPWSIARRRPGTVFDPPAQLKEIAVAVGRALQLRIYGVDVVLGADGPVVVDVNAFPSCNGVPGAENAIAEALLASGGSPAFLISQPVQRPVR